MTFYVSDFMPFKFPFCFCFPFLETIERVEFDNISPKKDQKQKQREEIENGEEDNQQKTS